MRGWKRPVTGAPIPASAMIEAWIEEQKQKLASGKNPN